MLGKTTLAKAFEDLLLAKLASRRWTSVALYVTLRVPNEREIQEAGLNLHVSQSQRLGILEQEMASFHNSVLYINLSHWSFKEESINGEVC
jgi:hypothetical protein